MHTRADDALADNGHYGEEVLNASWLPLEVLTPEMHPVQRTACGRGQTMQATDLDALMHRLYLAQE